MTIFGDLSVIALRHLVTVFLGNGDEAHGVTKLGTVRESYI
jgi:hypothetical protein